MLKRSLVVLGLVGCMSAFASAQEVPFVFVEYWEAGDTPDGINQTIEFDISDGLGGFQDVTKTVHIGVISPIDGGGVGFSGGDFDFSWPSNLVVDNFQWDDAYVNAPFPGWFLDNSIPAPAISTFGPIEVVPVGPNPNLALGTVSVTAIGLETSLGEKSIATSARLNDLTGEVFKLNEGSDTIPVNVVPEPATLALLVLGGFTALRRRRS